MASVSAGSAYLPDESKNNCVEYPALTEEPTTDNIANGRLVE